MMAGQTNISKKTGSPAVKTAEVRIKGVRVKKELAEEINARLARLYPAAATRLYYRSPWELLVAVLLSARATDEQVNRVTAELFRAFPTMDAMAAAQPEDVEPYLRSLGLYRQKSKWLVETARTLLNKYGGQVPASRQELEQLPGVGKKTAGVVLNILYGQPLIPVDTHVFRVTRRLGLAAGKTPERVENELESYIPVECRPLLHHRLIAFGREYCRARYPRCKACPLQDLCQSANENSRVEAEKRKE